ncbi:MAG TPA: hypothetical protein PKL83_07340, partial [bacterium]|nr:hypothetical protein [bacterium]
MHSHRHAILHHSYQRKDLSLLQKSTILRSTGISFLELFQPLYLLTNGLSLANLMLFYAIQWLLSFLLAPLWVNVSAKLGFSRSMLFSLSSFALYLICFTLAPVTGFISLIPAAILHSAYDDIFWPNYHYNFCELTRSD